MATVKEIREERKAGNGSKENLKGHVEFYFAHRMKMTIGEDAGFRAELRIYAWYLGMNMEELNGLCQEIGALAGLKAPAPQPSTRKPVRKKA